MKELFQLPHKNFSLVQEILTWCQQAYGPRKYGGPWEYHAVDHNVEIHGEANIMMFRLRWA